MGNNMDEFNYDAFISYSHADMKWGRWLQKKLETFKVPRETAKDRPGSGNLRIFRDQTDLAGADLAASLNQEIERSRFLIVICSPASAASRWVDHEIRTFCELGRKDRVIPFIVAGEPDSDQPEQECFPAALRDGTTGELLGANIREIGKDKAYLKTASVLLDIRFNRLVDREKRRRRRTAAVSAAVIAAVCAVTGGLIWNNARIRRENQELNFDIYGAALRSLKLDESLQPGEMAFLEASANAGNTEAMVLLGDCFLNGWGTAPEEEKAFGWFQRAAEQGNTQGMIGLGNCYLSGIGTEPDPAEVFQWNLRAAEAGDSSGMLNAASCYEEGYGTEKNTELALDWYQKSAEAGYELGMYHLARCYRAGIGTEADPEQAFRWMEKLAEAGNITGMYNTALMYQNGYGTAENPEEAYRWYRQAADAGDPDAMWMTGSCIESRYGIADAALEWYERAAAAGNEGAARDAERLRAALEQERTSTETD
ncbi:MAG: toll/interleukin-1 receptor domain-containing protein [Clostridia bacterium]|nr:toll/interleukin-1 receptor domain-containing protein [Clostridia bacterium]